MAGSTMRLFTGIVFCSLVMGVSSEGWYSFFKEAVQGAGDLCKAYWNLMASNHQNSNRYFYARGNYDAAQRGPGGVWAAKVISRFRHYLQGFVNYYVSGNSRSALEDLQSNQKAEEWGRSGKDPDHFRSDGMRKKY
ncbi:serum amyloid A-4 protein-like isoform X2 [Cebus imitator]|uniref:serum amyloid A-4 protein-like isoform X2 n=1 Tax=Cebus imitator TaxID=2715852 RepID=UPI000809F207|nr:serum amyloid A-4 protein-like isoform X2 [Cebus imitator]